MGDNDIRQASPGPGDSRRFPGVAALAALAAVTIAGAILRLKLGSSVPVSGDEMGSLIRSLNGIGGAIFNNDIKYNPPVHQIIISSVFAAGGTVGTARMVFSAISTLGIPVSFFMARRFLNTTAALLLAGIIAFNPQMISNGFLTRGICPACFFTLLAMYFLFDVKKRDRRHYHFLISVALAVYSHYFASLVFLFIAIHIYREKVKLPVNFTGTAVFTFLPAASMISWGLTARTADFPQSASVLQREAELLNEVFSDFSSHTAVISLVFLAITFIPWQKERLFRAAWIPSVAASFAISLFYRIHDYYLLPVFISGWAQLCSVVVPGRKVFARCIVVGLFTVLFLQYYSSCSYIFASNTINKNEAMDHVAKIKDAGINTAIMIFPPDKHFFYEVSMGAGSTLSMNKKRFTEAYTGSGVDDTAGLENSRLGITFKDFNSNEEFEELLIASGAPVAVIATTRHVINNHDARGNVDISGCAVLLKTELYESYLCRSEDRL
ncbi:MAG TPA: glycosyltransferase family 39 protein [bacterium]|nr:glycosyltransferase family 39 protein [bacterium]